MNKLSKLCAIFIILPGCATISYAPPDVQIDQDENLVGSIQLVDAFIEKYRERANGAGNGRQLFDVPAIGAAIGAVTAAAFGAGTDVTIAAGAVGALTSAGKTYYDPNAKAEIYSDGLNALFCIQNVALELQPFSENTNAVQRLNLENDLDDVRIFTAIKNAVLTVEENVRSRLKNTGATPDVESLTAELQAIVDKRNEAEDAAEDTANAMRNARVRVSAEDQQNLEKVRALIPKLEACAIRAKA